jgi:hypothetical protein
MDEFYVDPNEKSEQYEIRNRIISRITDLRIFKQIINIFKPI